MNKLTKLSLLLITALSVIASSVTYNAVVRWDSVSGTNLTWKVYLSSNGGPTNVVAVSTVSATVVTNLPVNSTNKMFVTAIDTESNLESLPSNTVTNYLAFPKAPMNVVVTLPSPLVINVGP